MKKYTKQFYERQVTGSVQSAEIILSALFEQIAPATCVDYGCGVGGWLSVCKRLGAKTVVGHDGAYVDRDSLLIDQAEFQEVDLENVEKSKTQFDLAISVEVAEHLSPNSAHNFVTALASSSNYVLFSAAIPGQGGVRHVNEQWQSYWVTKFRNHGFVPTTYVKRNFWDDERIEFWYRQNCILFVNKSRSSMTNEDIVEDFGPFDLVHPKQYDYYQRRGAFELLKSKLRSFKY